jgi:hypothetical protein
MPGQIAQCPARSRIAQPWMILAQHLRTQHEQRAATPSGEIGEITIRQIGLEQSLPALDDAGDRAARRQRRNDTRADQSG